MKHKGKPSTGFSLIDAAAKYPVLTQKEFNEHLKDWRENKNKKSYDKLVNHNIKLVLSIVFKRIKINGNLDFEDLCQAGMFGLMKAIDKFDPDMGYAFSTYATNWIRQSAQREQQNTKATIRIPVHKQKEMNQYFKAIRALPDARPTPEQICDWVKENISSNETYLKTTTPERIRYILAELNDAHVDALEDLSMGGEGTEEKETNYLESNNPLSEPTKSESEQEILGSISTQIIESILDEINFKERDIQIIQYRFGLKGHPQLTLEQTGDLVGLTRERVRQVQVKVMKAIKKKLARKDIYEVEDLVD